MDAEYGMLARLVPERTTYSKLTYGIIVEQLSVCQDHSALGTV